MKRKLIYALLLLVLGTGTLTAQKKNGTFLPFIIEGKDTVFIDELPASKVYPKLPKQKGKEWASISPAR